MSHHQSPGTDLVVYLAGSPLLEQIAAWAKACGDVAVRLSNSRNRGILRAMAAAADAVLIDASERPGAAVDVLRCVLPVCDPAGVAVYCEKPNEILSVIVNTAGVPLWTGVRTHWEWHRFVRRNAGPRERTPLETGECRQPYRWRSKEFMFTR